MIEFWSDMWRAVVFIVTGPLNGFAQGVAGITVFVLAGTFVPIFLRRTWPFSGNALPVRLIRMVVTLGAMAGLTYITVAIIASLAHRP